MKKRILSFALALCFVLTLLPAAFAGSGTASGTRCGAADPKYIASPALRITTVSGRPKITWNSVSGAKLYWVFRSTDGKKFFHIKETKNTSYIDKNVKPGTKYYYKVQAVVLYNGTFAIPSAYSYPVSITAK